MEEELSLLKGCIRGDKAKWDEFVLRYARLVYNYIYHTLKIKGCDLNTDCVRDLFQGIFSHLIEDNYRRLKNFKGKNGCKFSSWLRTITINYTIDYLRRLKPAVSLDEENENAGTLLEIIADDAPGPDEELAKEERLEQLVECIERLNTEEQYFIDLYRHKGLGLEELARIFRINRGALDMRKARIIEKLKECFKKKGFVIP